MGIRVCKLFVAPLLAVLLTVGCSFSGPEVVDDSAQEGWVNDETGAAKSADSDDEDELNDVPDDRDEKAPELPDAVNEPSESGVEAAAEYFFDAYEYAFHTSDGAALEKIFSKECQECEGTLDTFNQGKVLGNSAPDATHSKVEILNTAVEKGQASASLFVKLDGYTIYDKEGEVISQTSDEEYLFTLAFDRSEDIWLVSEIKASLLND